MDTPLNDVYEILNMFKSQDVDFIDTFGSMDIPQSFCKIGVIQASISLKKDFDLYSIFEDVDGKNKEVYYIRDISSKEVYLAGIYAYRNFAIKTHDELKRKAINFKTISFSVSGLTERAKEIMRTVWWCDGEIQRTLNNLHGSTSFGYATEMGDYNA